MKMIKPGKTIGAALLTGMLLVPLFGCEKGPAEKVGENIDEAAEKAGDQIEKAGNNVEDAVSDDRDNNK